MDPHVVLAMSESALIRFRDRGHGRSTSYKTTVQGSRRLQWGLERFDSVDRDSSRKVNSETDKDRLVLFLVLYLLLLVYPKNSSV